MMLIKSKKCQKTNKLTYELGVTAGCAASLLFPNRNGWGNSSKSNTWETKYRGNEKQVKTLDMGYETEKRQKVPKPSTF